MSLKTHPWAPPPAAAGPADEVRAALAEALRQGATLLGRWARALQAASYARRRSLHEPVIEFHAEASMSGGAVYVDGKLIGTLEGVNRL